jgi:hypothetical protein
MLNSCLICNSETRLFLSKTKFLKEYQEMVHDINKFEYYKCTSCGFTISETHVGLNSQRWEMLNSDFHHFIENEKAPINQPPYIDQALLLHILNLNNIIDLKNALDFAGGYGTLSTISKQYFGYNIPVFDPYVKNTENRDVAYVDINNKTYSAVINSALFEHITERSVFDNINSLVEPENGCMVIHTVICENIPADENWFYFEPPVHCAFHTNKSMEVLMNQWGYQASLYCPQAKTWVLFKKAKPSIKELIIKINRLFQSNYIIYNESGFVDYWKGF